MPKNFVTRSSRIAAYQRQDGPRGASRDEKNLAYWAGRAAENSQIAPRARDEMKLPDTGPQMKLRDTASAPRTSRNVDKVMNNGAASGGTDARAAAKSDRNDTGDSPFMKSIRRQA